MSFKELNISKKIIERLDTLKISNPTEVQQLVIPLILNGKDVVAISPTGSGKTEAYSIPIINKLLSSVDRKSGVIILSPTRELALQTHQRIIKLVPQGYDIQLATIIGGQSYEMQIQAIEQEPPIIIATPGRLFDLINQQKLDLERFDTLIIDEADEMLQLGFLATVFQILGFLPKPRQTLLFSATFPKELEKECSKILQDPIQIQVTHKGHYQGQTNQYLLFVDKNDKKELIRYLIDEYNIQSALIFTRTIHGVDRIVKDLTNNGYSAQGLYGDKSQSVRNSIVNDFKADKFRFLVATDIASRGLHLDHLNYVINYELPDSAEQYTHRIGRVGRSNIEGYAYTFCDAEDNSALINLQINLQKTIPIMEQHPYVLSWQKMLSANQLTNKKKTSSNKKRK